VLPLRPVLFPGLCIFSNVIEEKIASATVVLVSKDPTEFGFPRKLAIYHLEARQIGLYYCVPVLVLREHDIQAPRLPLQLLAESPDKALGLAVQHYRTFAEQHGLKVQIER